MNSLLSAAYPNTDPAASRPRRRVRSCLLAIGLASVLLCRAAVPCLAEPPCPTGQFWSMWAKSTTFGPNQFSDWCGGGNDDYAASNMAYDQAWSQIYEPGAFKRWADWKAQKPGRRVVLGIPMLIGGSGGPIGTATLAKGAHEFDTFMPDKQYGWAPDRNDKTLREIFQMVAQNLVKAGLDDVIVRPGWEMNGNWMPWSPARAVPVADGCADFAKYWKNIVDAMREVPGAEKLEFFYCPLRDRNHADPIKSFPEDEGSKKYVDYIGMDLYDGSYKYYPADSKVPTTPEQRESAWTEIHLGTANSYGLVHWMNFAKSHGKKFAIGEWGVSSAVTHSGGDNPGFIQHMYEYLKQNKDDTAFVIYFDYNAPDGKAAITPYWKPMFNPLSSAKFWQLWSSVSGPGAVAGRYIIDSNGNYATGVTKTGNWTSATTVPGFYRGDYLGVPGSVMGDADITFTPTLPLAGKYKVYARWPVVQRAGTRVPFTVTSTTGVTPILINQSRESNVWVNLGEFRFDAGTAGNVKISNTATGGIVTADAVKFELQ